MLFRIVRLVEESLCFFIIFVLHRETDLLNVDMITGAKKFSKWRKSTGKSGIINLGRLGGGARKEGGARQKWLAWSYILLHGAADWKITRCGHGFESIVVIEKILAL